MQTARQGPFLQIAVTAQQASSRLSLAGSWVLKCSQMNFRQQQLLLLTPAMSFEDATEPEIAETVSQCGESVVFALEPTPDIRLAPWRKSSPLEQETV